jgi:cytochrome P450
MHDDPWLNIPTRPGVDAWSVPLEDYDLSNPDLYKHDAWRPFFARLRAEAPVHWCRDSQFGPYWSVTRFRDIQYVDSHPDLFSSEPTIVLGNPPKDFLLSPGFIAMDPPRHGPVRSAAQPAVAPPNLRVLEPLIRSRVGTILDALPTNEEFDWVDLVAIELTTQMLATLFDFPWEDRRKLTYWSDIATSSPRQTGAVDITEEQWRSTMLECLEYFTRLWNERVDRPPGERLDLVTMLAQNPATRGMSPFEYLGNLILLIVGGNDTTRNSIAGGVLALNRHPLEYARLREHPELLPDMVNEIIRWQTPLAYMRRTATQDTELAGQRIRAGDKVVMWYISGNRDDSVIERADEFVIDRKQSRHHLAFGFGIHRCMGNRLAEMQLRIAWEEIQKRFRFVEVTGEPVRVRSSFVHGYEKLPVRVHPH